LQPWEFIVVRKGRERLFACTYSQMHVLDASATIIVLANKNPLAHAADILDDRLSKGYYVDPSARLLTMGRIKAIASSAEASLVWAVKSASLAAMTLMFAAYDMGLAACPIESFDKNAVKKEFKIPDDYEAIMLITLGYQSADQKPRLKRYGFDEIVHFEEF
ncbi:nitroreductase family protein, partial [Candidatus Woesearchaeota archaeon]|nr:nitroreductase family protein [Candidatus Woesearchaeota archaeon]